MLGKTWGVWGDSPSGVWGGAPCGVWGGAPSGVWGGSPSLRPRRVDFFEIGGGKEGHSALKLRAGGPKKL
jgi:hypothetical protein